MMADAASPFDLSGRVALVTGSSQGLGQATALALAQHGAHVIISSRKQDACEAVAGEMRDAGYQASALACNIGHQDQIDAVFDRIGKDHGRLDILVNNAVLSPWRTIEDTDRGLFLKALETNMGGYWFMSVGAAQLMKPQGRGSIINVSSTAARRPSKMLGLYATFKNSLDSMTRSFAQEFGQYGIRVNTILPGLFETSLADAYTQEQKRQVEAETPLGRLGDPMEVGHAILFLASDAAGYVTGTSLLVDGGRTNCS